MAFARVCRLLVLTVVFSGIAFGSITEVCPDGQLWEATCDVNPCFGSNNPCTGREDGNIQCIISRCRPPGEDCSYNCVPTDVVSITAVTEVTVVEGGSNSTQQVAVPTLVRTDARRRSPSPSQRNPQRKLSPAAPDSSPPPGEQQQPLAGMGGVSMCLIVPPCVHGPSVR